MEREYDDVIELGAVSVETKGLTAGKDDHQVGLIPFAGLDDE
ncbi:MAG TPA: benenodin family lasso peptide [Sphingomicrobium sp.]|nr:benenodin family lasso peptide [Sphingomicrobium sp.]